MKQYPNIPIVFTNSEEGHEPELKLYWITEKNNAGVKYETGIRVLMTSCTECGEALRLYAHYNTIPWTF